MDECAEGLADGLVLPNPRQRNPRQNSPCLAAARRFQMARESNPLERTSVQLMIGVAIIALCANSAVDRTDDGLPWEVTLGGFCVFAVIFVVVPSA